MTREEAIKLLTQYIDYDAETPDYYEMEKACKAAIKSLEQEPILDKIRAEIVKKHLSIVEKNGFDSGRTYGYEEVLDIIDKYKAERNDK